MGKDGVKAKLYTLQKDGKNIRNGRQRQLKD
jgi:hypothetical protein